MSMFIYRRLEGWTLLRGVSGLTFPSHEPEVSMSKTSIVNTLRQSIDFAALRAAKIELEAYAARLRRSAREQNEAANKLDNEVRTIANVLEAFDEEGDD